MSLTLSSPNALIGDPSFLLNFVYCWDSRTCGRKKNLDCEGSKNHPQIATDFHGIKYFFSVFPIALDIHPEHKMGRDMYPEGWFGG